ncbi:Uncharacterised protein [Vibrio cholerae]|nr:Uncharacterised protein [Vibrio cholerae]
MPQPVVNHLYDRAVTDGMPYAALILGQRPAGSVMLPSNVPACDWYA